LLNNFLSWPACQLFCQCLDFQVSVKWLVSVKQSLSEMKKLSVIYTFSEMLLGSFSEMALDHLRVFLDL
jgi:hypothetical protein